MISNLKSAEKQIIHCNPESTNTLVVDYSYDPLYRLTGAEYSTGEVYTYTYDKVGNRLAQETLVGGQSSVVNYQYDEANRLTSVNGVSYTWDANGNLLSDGVNTYTYDDANRLIALSNPQSAFSFSYDGLGNRYKQIENGIPTTYTLDTAADLSQVLSDGEYTYLYGLTRFAQQSATSTDYFPSPALRASLPDALGSVRQIYSQGSGIGLTQTFDPFGNLLSQEGSLSSRYGFAGEWADVTGLQHLRARYYSPAQGRFLNRDPFPGILPSPQTQHPYVYVANNPILNTDPTGMFTPWDVLDVGSFLWSLSDFYYCPSWANFAWLALDVIGLLPIIPSIGLIGKLGKIDNILKISGKVDDIKDLKMVGRQLILPGLEDFLQKQIPEKLSKAEKVKLNAQARELFYQANPRFQKYIGTYIIEIHHRIPLKWEHLFPTPNRLSNLYALPTDVHRKIVNPLWKFFETANPNATPAQVLEYAMYVDKIIAPYINRIP